MPMVLAANCVPTRARVPDIIAGKIGAIARPMIATATTLAISEGFQMSNPVPVRAPARPPSTSLYVPTRFAINPAAMRPSVKVNQ